MPYIRVDLQKLAQLEDSLRRLSGQIGDAVSDVTTVRRSLDWDVACEDAIDSRLHSISQRLEACQRRMVKTAAFVEAAVGAYKAAEQEELNDTSVVATGQAANVYYQAAAELKKQQAIRAAVSKEDPVFKYLMEARKKNEAWYMQAGAYMYNIASFQWGDAVKKAIPGSEEVDSIRKQAVQAAYASILQTNKPTYTETDLQAWLSGITIDGGDQLNTLSGAIMGLTNYKDAGKIADGGCGEVFNILGYAVETGFDLHHYAQWNTAQQQIFFESLSSAGENLKLLNELKTAFPDDKVLTDFCNEMIGEIEAYAYSENLYKLVDSLDAIDESGSIIVKNAAESAADYAVPKLVEAGINKLLGKGGGVITAVGSGAGYLAEVTLGTGTTAETYENVDILCTNIEQSIDSYNRVASDSGISDTVKRFQELNILNQKMAGLELTTNINQTFGVKNAELVEDISGLKDGLQRSYDVLAQI